MGLLDKLTGGVGSAIGGFIKQASSVVDKFVQTKEEKQQAKLELKALANEFRWKLEQEASKRHKYDMQSDSWLSKNVRPLVLLWSLVVVTAGAFIEGAVAGFTIPSAYIDLMGNVLIAAIGFYFVTREYGKHKINDSLKELKKEREKTLRKKVERGDDLKVVDLPKVSLKDELD